LEGSGPSAGGLQELLRRANVELGSAIRTTEPGGDTGNNLVIARITQYRRQGRIDR